MQEKNALRPRAVPKVFPPLRRGVAKMLILCANGRPPEDDWARKATDVSSYFGRVPADRAISTGSGDIDAATFNASQQAPGCVWGVSNGCCL